LARNQSCPSQPVTTIESIAGACGCIDDDRIDPLIAELERIFAWIRDRIGVSAGVDGSRFDASC